MSATTESVDNVADRAIFTSRVFDDPREKVFRAWAEADHIIHWWGPNGFTNTFHEFNFSPNGKWSFIMHGPDGGNYPNESEFVEIKRPERIVIDHISNPKFRLTATFEDVYGKTKLTFHMLFVSKDDADKVRAIVVPSNEQNLDRLEVELRKMN